MRKFTTQYSTIWLICLFASSIPLNGQPLLFDGRATTQENNQLFWLALLEVDSGRNPYLSENYNKLRSFFAQLSEKKYQRQDWRALKKLYREVGSTLLKEYERFTFLPELLDRGAYDCVSASMLYAFIFEKMGYAYSIYATYTHVYVVVHLPEKDVILEATDPVYGLEANPRRQAERIEAYVQESRQAFPQATEDSAWSPRRVTLQELVGLQYYNLFWVQYQDKNYAGATRAFNRAAHLYGDAPEIQMLSTLFANL